MHGTGPEYHPFFYINIKHWCVFVYDAQYILHTPTYLPATLTVYDTRLFVVAFDIIFPKNVMVKCTIFHHSAN